MESILKIEHLNKKLGKKQILHDVSFETFGGEVFGFLGPNGAGKTTTIKIVVGLLTLDSGDILVAGESITKNYEGALRNIGAIVENPEMYKHLTGMENLRQFARIRSIGGEKITQQRIDEVVELVRLKNRINDKVSKYSLGMRQRLGVAQALLHKPKLLILDEPTNGLDPAGIKELRDILKETAHNEGVSVVVSSHLMSEMELMCDRVGILVEGKLIDVKTIEEMTEAASGSTTTITLHVSNAQQVFELLDFIDESKKTVIDDDHIRISSTVDTLNETAAGISKAVVNGGVDLYSLVPKENKSLEDVFIELTNTSGGAQIG